MIHQNHYNQKITTDHLSRDAFLYIRQSSLKQVMDNQESTKRQYGLKDRAIALGWPVERIITIDDDLGQSGAKATDREGFQKLVAEVSMGRAGIVMGLEVSRLARNSTDWHRLLEICVLTRTLILDEDGVYDPSQFNDRLLLGLKGTMSEAELHILRARLQGGILNKARRGELQIPIPVGFVYDVDNKVILDPDKQVQNSIKLFFNTFKRTGSAFATLKYFRQKGIKFPKRLHAGVNKGTLVWSGLTHSRARQMIHNPRYAGTFAYGKSRLQKRVNAPDIVRKLPQDEWYALIPDAHQGYISWQEYEENKKILSRNSHAWGNERKKGPPREGPALIQGLVLCGICGSRMTVRYHSRRNRLVPDYVCQSYGIQHGEKICQHIPGRTIDEAIGKLLIKTVSPMTLEVALSVQEELKRRNEEVDNLRKKTVERARYEADMAQRRYMQVDPGNRLVADALEADWNEKLRTLTQSQENYEKQRNYDNMVISDQQRLEIVNLARGFSELWNDSKTPDREKKRMAQLIIEDITLIKKNEITVHVRFKGGALETLHLPKPLNSWQEKQTEPEVITEIDHLLEDYTEGQIAFILNKKGAKSGMGCSFNSNIVRRIRHQYKIKTRLERLQSKGLLTKEQLAKKIGVSPVTLLIWRRRGLLKAYAYSDKPEYLFEPIEKGALKKMQGIKFSKRDNLDKFILNHTKEVQYEV